MSERSDAFDFEIRDQNAKEAIVTPHRHEFFQIHVNLRGKGAHIIGGAAQPFEENTVIFILPYRIHYTPAPPPVEYYVINFSANFLRPELMMPPFEMEEASIREFPELAPFIFQGLLDYVFPENEFEYIRQVTDRLMSLQNDRRLGTTERIRGHVLDLIGLTTERYEQAFKRMGQKRAFLEFRTEALTRALRFIDQELHNDITLKQVSEAAYISANYLSQLLKKQTGMAFVEWLTARRLERAQELLAHTNLKVFEIANKVGFEDAAYFTRRFRQRLDVSPLDYRKKMIAASKS